MGKELRQNLQQQQHEDGNGRGGSSGIFCERCSMGLSRIYKEFSFRCFFVLILSLGVLVSGIFWILPFRTVKLRGYDANDSIKLSASVQAYFRLEKPVSQLVPHVDRLEYDINDEIGVPGAKVAVLSMHQSGVSNWTDVVFGVLSNSIDIPINQVSLSVLRSSLIEVLLHESNLTLTTSSVFGQPSMFEILKFSGGITVIPVPYASIWQRPQILFNFTLNNSIAEILDNLTQLRDQLKFGLYLRPYENVIVQLTNTGGSTINPPIIVQAAIMSDLGRLLPQRLKQLAQTITDSPSKNLGLDNSVFGNVKSIMLSSYLKRTLHANPPTPSPAPSPDLNDYAEPPISPCPASSPSVSPAASPSDYSQPHPVTSPKGGLQHSLPPVNSPAHSTATADPPDPCGHHGSSISPSPSPSRSNRSPYFRSADPPTQPPPNMAPSPQVSSDLPMKGSVSQLLAPSPSALAPTFAAANPFYRELWWLGISGLLIFHLFCWSY